MEYANTFPELAKLNLSTSNVLDYVTADKYNFATVSHRPTPFSYLSLPEKALPADH